MNAHEKTDSWFDASRKDHREHYSELDVLLRSMERFFHVEYLPSAGEDLPSRNFHNELIVVRDVIFRVLAILEVVIPESKKNAYWFQKFTETKFLSGHSRDAFRGNLYRQDSPEKGMYLLYDLFINLKGIVTDLLKTGKISYLSFKNIGQLISREIRENTYLNPFRKDINPDFDIIENAEIANIVKSIKDPKIKKSVSLLYIYLFRFLRYIGHIDISSQHRVSLHASLLILILLRSEITMFHTFVRKTGESLKNATLRDLLNSLSYQFSMEMKRVYLQELKGIMHKKTSRHFRGKIENSTGILKNLTEQSIVQLVQFFRPGMHGEGIFRNYTNRVNQSVKLKEDIYVLNRFLSVIEERAGHPEQLPDILEKLKSFMRYFESFTFKMLRYDDYEEFSYFFNMIFSHKAPPHEKILEKIHNFRIFLETTLRHISDRAELKDKTMDVVRAEEMLKQYL